MESTAPTGQCVSTQVGDTLDPAIGVPFMLLIAFVFIEAAVLSVLGWAGKLKLPFRKSVGFTLGGIMLYCLCRMITIGLWLKHFDITADTVFNRLSWIFFVLTCLLLIFGWIEAIHMKYPAPSDKFIPIVKWAFIVLAIGVTLLQIVTMSVYLAVRGSSRERPEQYAAYSANILIFCILLLGIRLAFKCCLSV